MFSKMQLMIDHCPQGQQENDFAKTKGPAQRQFILFKICATTLPRLTQPRPDITQNATTHKDLTLHVFIPELKLKLDLT